VAAVRYALPAAAPLVSRGATLVRSGWFFVQCPKQHRVEEQSDAVSGWWIYFERKMVWRCVLRAVAALLLLVQGALAAHSGVTLRNSGYEGLVLAIADTVPYEECDQILSNLKVNILWTAGIEISETKKLLFVDFVDHSSEVKFCFSFLNYVRELIYDKKIKINWCSAIC